MLKFCNYCLSFWPIYSVFANVEQVCLHKYTPTFLFSHVYDTSTFFGSEIMDLVLQFLAVIFWVFSVLPEWQLHSLFVIVTDTFFLTLTPYFVECRLFVILG